MNPAAEFKAGLLGSLARERQLAADETANAAALSLAALEARGNALRNLEFAGESGSCLELRCPRNNSKFREGDTVVLSAGNGKVKARIRTISEGGRKLTVACRKPQDHEPPITMLESDEDVSAVFSMALKKLVPGAPGWWLLESLAGTERGKRLLEERREDSTEAAANVLREETGLDPGEAFHPALLRCLAGPRLLSVQGPPGTGKTYLLALAAEGLARQGRRVAVTAHTHQAVNNALSTIKKLFPGRRVVKLGGGIRREGLADEIPCVILKDEFGGNDAGTLDGTIFGLTFASATIELSLRQSLFSPHALLVDEAGQLPLACAAGMGMIGAGSHILFGDDRQMPPVFRTGSDCDPLAVSVFGHFRNLYPEHHCQLRVTHRLNDELCAIVSRVFYEEAGLAGIRPSRAAADRRLSLSGTPGVTAGATALRSSPSLVWIDSPGRNCRERNEWEAKMAVEIVEEALAGGIPSAGIAVIAPFRRQVALIRAMLSERLGSEGEPPIADTVERLQGMTVELVIVSATAGDPEYVSAIGDFLFSANRLNVSVSRARTKVIVLGSKGLWDALPTTISGLEGQRIWSRFREQAMESRQPAVPER